MSWNRDRYCSERVSTGFGLVPTSLVNHLCAAGRDCCDDLAFADVEAVPSLVVMRRGLSGANARCRNSDNSTAANVPTIRSTGDRVLNPLEEA